MPRSTRVHADHQSTVALALQRNGFLTQGDLAAHLEIALSTVSNFFRGLNVSISKFETICTALGLDPRTLILPQASQPPIGLEPCLPPIEFFAYDDTWVGRESLIAELQQKLNGSCRLLLITGIAGMGKTALAERLFVELYKEQSSKQGNYILRLNFDNQDQAADFGSVAARLLEECGQPVTPDDRQDVQQLTRHLVRQLQGHRHLLVIDSLEELLQGNEQFGWSRFKDAGFLSFFQQLLAADTCQSRLIITSQELPIQLLEFGTRYQNFWFNQPLPGLSEAEQIALFAKTGLDVASEGGSYLLRIGKAYEGHPLALRVMIGEIGSHPFFGNVVAYWNRYGREIEEVEQAIAAAQRSELSGAKDKWRLDRFTRALRHNVQKRLEQTFRRLKSDAKYAYILLCEAAVYRCPVPEDWWLSHLDYWDCSAAVQQAALDGLKDRFLVETVVERDQYLLKQHNLIRSVSLNHLKLLDQIE